MTVVLRKNFSSKQIAMAKRKLKRKKQSKSGIGKYFGALKRGLDGMEYQNEVRNEWN